MTNVYEGVVRKFEEKISVWKGEKYRIPVRVNGCEVVDCIHLSHSRH
jgi:hypothetical protein